MEEQGYIKKTVQLYIKTSVGDKWKSDECIFTELKNGAGYIVDDKEKERMPGTN